MDVNGSEDCEPTMNISMFNGDIDVMYPILVFVTKVISILKSYWCVLRRVAEWVVGGWDDLLDS